MADPTEAPKGGFRLLLVPDDAEGRTRSYRLSGPAVRALKWGLGLFTLVVLLLAGSWAFLLRGAIRANDLQERVVALEAREERLLALVERLEIAEERYENVRRLFGADSTGAGSDLWLPPAGSPTASAEPPAGGDGAPSRWPLSERGFITQRPLLGEDGEHRGLDIAVPSNSYIRAAGGGEVAEVGEDPVYGRYVVLDHGDGYRSLYGHAAETLVEVGQEVRPSEVIALSGSTGRSTAPHLHFEILLDGEPVDPLSLVNQP